MTSIYIKDEQKLKTALDSDPVAVRVLNKNKFPVAEDKIGVRLNLNILKSTGMAIQTLHQATNDDGYKKNHGFYDGEVLGYAEAITLKNAYFNVNQKGRENICSNIQNKFAMASIDGELVRIEENVVLDGVEVCFNPKKTHLFVDKDNYAIHYAEKVTIVGHRAYASGKIIYHTTDSAPARAGENPTNAIFKTHRTDLIKNLVQGVGQDELSSTNNKIKVLS